MEGLIDELHRLEAVADRCQREFRSAVAQIEYHTHIIHEYYCSKHPNVWIIVVERKGIVIQLPGYFATQKEAEEEYNAKKFMLYECGWAAHGIFEKESNTIPLKDLVKHLPIAPLLESKHVW